MPLTDRPDFKAWLERFEADYRDAYYGEPPRPVLLGCACCGGELADGSSTDHCLLCLAERFGADQAAAAGRVAAAVQVALAADGGTPPDVIRAAVEDALDEHELTSVGRAG